MSGSLGQVRFTCEEILSAFYPYGKCLPQAIVSNKGGGVEGKWMRFLKKSRLI